MSSNVTPPMPSKSATHADGVASSAACASTRPHPNPVSYPTDPMSRAVLCMIPSTSDAVSDAFLDSTSAATPAAYGDANDVPLTIT